MPLVATLPHFIPVLRKCRIIRVWRANTTGVCVRRGRSGRSCETCDADISSLHALRRRCDECQRQLRNKRLRDWRAANAEQARELERRRDLEARNARSRERYATEPDYRQAKIDRASLRHRPRRDRLVAVLAERDGLQCSWCGEVIADPADGALVHVDHVKPLSAGGSDDLGNMQLLHAECNLSKGVRE